MNAHTSRLIGALLVLLLTLIAARPAPAQSIYDGNGASGFDGAVGLGTLSISDNPNTGIISFVLDAGGVVNDDMVIYIDSVAGGFANNSEFSDNGDGGREAISGANIGNSSRVAITFAPGFLADYAIGVQNDNASLFQLESGGNDSFNFLEDGGLTNPSGNIYDFSINASEIGLTAGSGERFTFEATYISTGAYGSDETIGASATIVDPGNLAAAPNAGANGSVTFSGSNSYTLSIVPEPSSIGTAALGIGLLLFARRRLKSAG